MRVFLSLLLVCINTFVSGQSRLALDSLTRLLELVYEKDQVPRDQLDAIVHQYGYNSVEVKKQWALINKNDSDNIQKVVSILDTYGWLSDHETSKQANNALFLVVQHAGIEVQLRYIEILKEAAQKNKAKPSQYAYLLDRVNMRTGKLQVYGTQQSVSTNGKAYYYPIKDVLNVNKRRATIGLPPLKEVSPQPGSVYNMPGKVFETNTIVITGFVFDKDQTPINKTVIKLNTKVVATTNADGFYIAAVEKKFLNELLIFYKKGYILSDPPLNDEDKEVYEMNILLTKE